MVIVNENVSFWSGIGLPVGCKFARNKNMTSKFAEMTSQSFFLLCHVSLVKFSYWSKFNVNIIIGSGIRTIFVYKGSATNLEIGNTHV